jgi:hypothetical protein
MRRFRSSPRTHHITSPASALVTPTSLFSLFYLGIQGCVSHLVGLHVTKFFLYEKKYIFEDLVKLPLVEGQSGVSEALCPDSIKAYHSIQSKGFDWSRSDYKNSQLISTFVLNCKKRQAYEEKLRLARRLPQNQPVCIPSPGVPSDQPYEMEDYLPKEEIIDNKEKRQNSDDSEDSSSSSKSENPKKKG